MKLNASCKEEVFFNFTERNNTECINKVLEFLKSQVISLTIVKFLKWFK